MKGDDNIMKELTAFAKELKKLRMAKGMSVRALSESSGVSHSYISQIENGTRDTPQPDLIKKLSKGLEMNYYSLMRTAGYLDETNEMMQHFSKALEKAPQEYKINYLNDFNKKIKSFELKGFPQSDEFDKAEYDMQLNYYKIALNGIDETKFYVKFKNFFISTAKMSDYLQLLRIYRGITIDEMTNLLEMDLLTYKSLESKLINETEVIKKYGKKIGEVLGITDFEVWVSLSKRLRSGQHYSKYNFDQEVTEITFAVPSVIRETDDDGNKRIVKYTKEELKRNFYNLDFLLSQNDHVVLFKDKILNRNEIKKIKIMLDVLLGDD